MEIKTAIKKFVTFGLVLGAAYVAGRCTGFMDTVNKYNKDIMVDSMGIGFFRANDDFAGIGWNRPLK